MWPIAPVEEFSLATRLDYAAKAGATTITVRAPVLGWANRQIRLISRDAGTTEIASISTVVGRTVTLSTGLTNAFAAGSIVEILLESTDLRNRDHKFFVPCSGGWNATLAAATYRTDTDAEGHLMPNDNDCYMFGEFTVPEDFVSGMTVIPIVVPNANGNIYSTNSASYGGLGEGWANHSDAIALAAVGVSQLLHSAGTATLALVDVALRDLVHLQFGRLGANGADTLAIVYFLGWLIEYTADS